VSIDGLQPEHDERRTPATYDRILKHIDGHQITVHCTVTRQQVRREGYIEEFLSFWQTNPNVRLMWISLYTPQIGEISMERLTKDDRLRVVAELRRLRPVFSKFQMLDGMLNVYANPPQSPDECMFAQTTECLSSDLERRITPCQLGGNPDCANCGCVATAGLEAIGRHKLKGVPAGRQDLSRPRCRWATPCAGSAPAPARRTRGCGLSRPTALVMSRARAERASTLGRMFSAPTWRWNSARSISDDGCGSAPHSSSVRPDACSASAKILDRAQAGGVERVMFRSRSATISP
jgi:sulfatase maturation enzyme AslB (radical SAM superfamily)